MSEHWSVLTILLLLLPFAATAAVAGEADEPAFQGKGITEWCRALSAEDVSARRQAIWAIWNLRAQARQAAPQVAVLIRDDDQYVRETAMKTLPYIISGAVEALPDLEVALRDSRVETRRAAGRGLGLIGPGVLAASASLLRALEDEDPVVRTNVLGACIWFGPEKADLVLPAIGRLITDDADPGVRAWAANTLLSLGAPKGLPIAAKALADPDPRVRERALAFVGSMGPDPDFPLEAVLAALADPDMSVRRTATGVAAEYVGRKAAVIEALLAVLKDEQAWVRASAVDALSRLHPIGAEAVGRVAGLLGEEDDFTRANVLRVLGQIGPEAAPWLDAIRGLLGVEQSLLIRREAARVLGLIGPPAMAALPELRALLAGEVMVAVPAALAICRIAGADEEALARLIAALDDPLWASLAAMALGDLGPCARDAVPRLRTMLAGTPNESLSAARALILINGEDDAAMSHLVSTLRHSNEIRTRMTAARHLGGLGQLPEDAISALLAALVDPDEGLAVKAGLALAKLGPAAQAARPTLRQLLVHRNAALRQVARDALLAIER